MSGWLGFQFKHAKNNGYNGAFQMNDKQPTYTVTFLPANKSIKVKNKTSLIKAAQKAGLHINASCGGAGVCGKCRVLLEQGVLEGGNSEKLSAEEYNRGYRQACIAEVIANILENSTPTNDDEHGAIKRDEINSITIAGNTTMTHLLLELEPDNIRR
ncbi:2Fe-2S iron-sulfur cluster binding domain-containing protein, partial [Desulfotalea psychrophila]|nr:2Fe-2S iron-sulfur cluster binding domain-containing protein [Desulfotalea psychrophila]